MTTPGRRGWEHPRLGSALGPDLPCGGLSLFDVGTPPSEGHWPTMVGALVEGTIAARRPVFFVQVGGCKSSYANGHELRQRFEGQQALTTGFDLHPYQVSEDQDLVVYGPVSQSTRGSMREQLSLPATVDGSPYYSCHVPTLVSIQQEPQQGPGDPYAAVDDARRGLAEEKIKAFIGRTVAAAPGLSSDQRARLSALLAPQPSSAAPVAAVLRPGEPS